MKTTIRNWALGLLVSGLIWAPQVGAQADAPDPSTPSDGQTEENQLNNAQKELSNSQEIRVEQLAEHFQIDQSVVTDLRNKGRGWGEVNHELTLAEHLTKIDPETYPSVQDGLTQIDQMRDEGMGYGQIAKEFDTKLGFVGSGAKEDKKLLSGQEESSEGQLKSLSKPTKIKPEKKGFSSEKPQKLRHTKIARPNRPARVERPHKLNRPHRPHKPAKPFRPGR